MSDCGVCLTSDVDGDWEFAVDDTSTVTLNRDEACGECKCVIPSGSPLEEATCFDNEDDDENGDPIPPHPPIYTCLVCAEIAEAFYCEGRMWGVLWESMGYIMEDLNSSCFDRLTTPAAKAELRRRWMRWKGLAS